MPNALNQEPYQARLKQMQTLFENQNFYEHNFTGLDGKYKITKDAYKIKTNELNLYGGKYTTLLDARKK